MKRASLLALLVTACAHSPAAPAAPRAAPASEASAASSPARSPAARPRPAPAVPGDLSTPRFPPADAPPADGFAEVRETVDALLRSQGEALWAAWTRGERIDLAGTYAGREGIFSPESVRRIESAARAASGDEQRALQLLHAFVAGEHLERETRDSASRLARARAAATVAWNGQAISPDRASGYIVSEPDAARRAALYRLQADAVAKWAPAAAAHAAELDAAARRLGHPSAVALGAELRGSSTEELAAFAERVLADTDAAYQEAMNALAKAELGRPLSEVRGADVPRLFRASAEPRMFPAARLLPDVRALFAGLGLEVEGRPGVRLDLEARPGKDPRALALPVAVPGDVRLSAVPGAGLGEVRALLHETALASYYSRIESPWLEFRRLGNTTGEVWALLFEELAGDPQWLLERTGDTEPHLAPLVRSAAARRLHSVREAALRLLLELKRPSSDADATRVATPLLERAYARRVAPEEVAIALAERDPLLQSATGLRAAILAAQAEAFLRAGATDGAWWKDVRVGAFLRPAFAEGSRPDPAALSAAFGASTPQPSAVAIRARESLRWAESH